MTAADRLRSRADELDHIAETIRWTQPHESRSAAAVAREMRDIASRLPPERTEP
jgi:hypothetical protein